MENEPTVEPLTLSELTNTLSETLFGWAELGVTMLPNVIVAVVILAFGYMMSRLAASISKKALGRMSDNTQVNTLLTLIVKIAVLAGSVFGALAVLRLDGVVTSMLAGVGVVGLALGFAFQDIAANLMSGVMMAMSRPFHVGDLVKTQSFFGTVEGVNLRVTRMRTPTGELVLIPNKDVVNNPLVNYTETTQRRVDLDVGVSYSDNLEEAQSAIQAAIEGAPFSLDDQPVQVFFTGFGGSSIDITVRFWIEANAQVTYMEAKSEAVMLVKETLDHAGVSIPFPIRTLDFGAQGVGGVRLDKVLTPLMDAEPVAAK